jgi:hypothetical protein
MSTEDLQAMLRQDCEMATDLDLDVWMSVTEELASRLGHTGKDARDAWEQFVRKNLTEPNPGTKPEKILFNRARCRKCGSFLESKSVHDLHRCACGAVAIDGGLEYLRRLGEPEDIEELSEIVRPAWDETEQR